MKKKSAGTFCIDTSLRLKVRNGQFDSSTHRDALETCSIPGKSPQKLGYSPQTVNKKKWPLLIREF